MHALPGDEVAPVGQGDGVAQRGGAQAQPVHGAPDPGRGGPVPRGFRQRLFVAGYYRLLDTWLRIICNFKSLKSLRISDGTGN